MNNFNAASLDCVKLKYLSSINDEALPENTDPDWQFNYIDIGNVDSNGNIDSIVQYQFDQAPSRARRVVKEGDVIISTVRTYLQAITSIDFKIDNLIVSTGFAVVRPKVNVFNPRFCKYALRQSEFLNEVQRRSVGVSYPAINASDLGDIKIPVPPIEKQEQLANYLDVELNRIKGLIQVKESQLTLLSEKRQALITQAVTKGIYLNIRLKDTEVDWLGEIPEHWRVKKLKYVVDKIDEVVDQADFIIAVENIESATGKLVDTEKEKFYEGSLFKFQFGDVIFNKLRPYLAKVYLAEKEGACVGELLILRGNKEIIPEFLFFRMLSIEFISHVNSSTVGAKMPRANWDDFIKHIKIGLPPIEEQIEIANFISAQQKAIQRIYDVTVRSIELLEERKTSLITSAVTGKLKIANENT